MEELYIKLGTLSNLKFGISTYAIRLVSMYQIRLNWNKFNFLLHDIKMFYAFNSYEDYLSYVLSMATYFIDVTYVTTKVSNIFETVGILKPFANYMITFEELEFILKIYDEIISKSIFNAKKRKEIFDFKITLNINEIVKIYKDSGDSLYKVDRFMQALKCFIQYNQFFFMGYEADFYSYNNTMTLNFYEDE